LSGAPVDLPSEAQWEFAARNRGQHVIYPTDTGTLDFGRNYPPRTDEMHVPVHPVGSFAPNPLGLYDMAGNAKDWVNDWYDPDYYPNSPLDNPKGPETGLYKIMRGHGVDEAPSILANTVVRWPEAPDQTAYSTTASFRCSVQSSNSLK
ncbi:formylglycine-generating enzyme family protein, partial [Pseudomonas sp.]|uniref:formylglycine-generating enzyme family protein n=1 Tax=Pseudomonas sp. TaxID=306 RepID=UPI003C725F71